MLTRRTTGTSSLGQAVAPSPRIVYPAYVLQVPVICARQCASTAGASGPERNRSQGLIVLQLEGGGMERSEVVGRRWPTPQSLDAPMPHCRQPIREAKMLFELEYML
jgi:hypothetical protein